MKRPSLTHAEIKLIAEALEFYSEHQQKLYAERESLKREIVRMSETWKHTGDFPLLKQLIAKREELAQLQRLPYYSIGEASKVLAKRFAGIPEGHIRHSSNTTRFYLERVNI